MGSKLADRWLSLLVLPGVLYLAVGAAAHTLGHRHALDLDLLSRQVNTYAKQHEVTSTGGQITLLVAVVVAAAAAGVCAQAVGVFVERLVMAAGWTAWPRPLPALTRRWVQRRQRRWDNAHRDHHHYNQLARLPDPAQRGNPALRHNAASRRARIAVERPERPTWSGDRIQAAVLRLDRDWRLDLAVVWPYLDPVVPDDLRTRITDARAAVSRAGTLAGWAVLYAPLTWWWWPASPITIVMIAAARQRFRAGADLYARLLEVAARLHAPDLAEKLGFDHTGPLTPQLGATISHHLRSELPPPT